MKICQFWIGIVGLALVTSGCISEILVPPLEFEREYVISGRLTDSLDVQEVLVMYTHGVGQNVPEFAEAMRHVPLSMAREGNIHTARQRLVHGAWAVLRDARAKPTDSK